MKLKMAVAFLISLLLISNDSFAQTDTTNKDDYRKFSIGIDFPKLFTLGGMRYGKHSITRAELNGRYFFHKNLFVNLGLGFSEKKDVEVQNGEKIVNGSYGRLGIGADVGPNKTARFAFAYNLCYSGYKSEAQVTFYDQFWNETYKQIIESKTNTVVFHELYSGFRLNFLHKTRIGMFVENGLRVRLLSGTNQNIAYEDYVPGFGTYNTSTSIFMAYNIITGITF